jgi:hypothetical protein
MQWPILVVPATQEAEAGGLLEFKSLTPAWQHSKTLSPKKSLHLYLSKIQSENEIKKKFH